MSGGGQICLGRLGKTVLKTVSATPDNFGANASAFQNFVIWSERAVHLSKKTAATVNDFLLLSDTYASVMVERGETLSFVLAAGETDGDIRLTEV